MPTISNKGMPNHRRRVLILSEIIAPYRIPVFNALARDERVDLHVVFLSETDAGLRQWPIYKDEIRFSYEVLPSARLRAGKSNLLLNWKLRSCLEKFAPDAIICGGYNYVASWEALWWAKNRGTEMILWAESNRHDARSGRGVLESLKSYFLSRCDRFVVPGRASREYLQSLGVAETDISIAPNAVDNGWFELRRTPFARIRPNSAHDSRCRSGFFFLWAGWFRKKACSIFSTPMPNSKTMFDRRSGWSLRAMGRAGRNWSNGRNTCKPETFVSRGFCIAKTLPASMPSPMLSFSRRTAIPGDWW